MRIILAISENVFRKGWRSKIFIMFLFFAIGLILLSKLFESLTFTAQLKIIKDIGLATISFFTALIAIFFGGESISKEIEDKTIYTILSKPVDRISFILGNFLGVIWVALSSLLITGFTLFVLLYFKGEIMRIAMLEAFFFIFLEIAVITSIAIMFSSFCSSSFNSTIFAFLIYLIGHFNPQLKFLGEKTKGMENILIKSISWILPNLEYFNVREKAIQGIPISLEYTGKALLYSSIYICTMLIIAYLFLRKREF